MSKTIEDFCKDVCESLKAEDRKIYEAMNENVEFNEERWKGLGLFSITEPILKYILYTKLIHKYLMWSEERFGYEDEKTNKYLDLAVALNPDECSQDDEGHVYPDTAIEMKWAGVKRNGDFNTRSKTRATDDINKLARNTLKNRYFMQFMIVKKGVLDGRELINLNNYVDKRRVKIIGEPIHHFFDTDSGAQETKYEFHIVAWKVGKRTE